MQQRILNIASGLLLVALMLAGSTQVLHAQQDKATTPALSTVTLDVTGMT